MAKKKRRRSKKKNNTLDSIALVSVIVALVGLFRLGFVGQVINATLRLLVGELYPAVEGIALIYAGYLLFTSRKKRPFPRWLWHIVWLLPIVALALHAIQFASWAAYDQSSLLGVTWVNALAAFRGDFDTLIGGGMLGGLLYRATYFLVSQVGTILVIIVALLIWIAVVLQWQLTDITNAITTVWQVLAHGVTALFQWIGALIEKGRADEPTKQQAKAQTQRKSTQPKPEPQPAPDAAVEIVGPDDDVKADAKPQPAAKPKAPSKPKTRSKPADEAPLVTEASTAVNDDYQLPTIDLLHPAKYTDQSKEYAVIRQNIRKLEQTFASFRVDAKVTKAHLGPSVTRYEVQPAVGTKVSKITNLADDIALALAAKDIRIEAPIPGESMIGIEVPNQTVTVVSFADVIEHAPESSNPLEVALGRDISGNVITSNLAKMPHLLVAGATGSGKSVAINGMIVNILMHAKPNEVKMMMIDPKKVELTVYNGIPHLLTPVVTNPRQAAGALNKVVTEMERRYELFADTGQRNINGYNHYVETENQKRHEALVPLPYIVVIVDELADLMTVASKEVETAITRLAQMARAAGIHMILATQRPSVDVITGIIKANVPSRIGFSVSSGTDSRTIIDQNGAEKLLGRGDMLYLPMGSSTPIRVQGAFISDDEVANVVNFIKEQQGAQYVEAMEAPDVEENADEDVDALWDDVLAFLATRDTVSISMLQRRFRIGYNRAARIIDDLEKRQLVGPQEGSKPRKVYLETNQPAQEQE